jgi:CRISPR/Cas system-associated protein Cas5 (RAMP superfamily)
MMKECKEPLTKKFTILTEEYNQLELRTLNNIVYKNRYHEHKEDIKKRNTKIEQLGRTIERIRAENVEQRHTIIERDNTIDEQIQTITDQQVDIEHWEELQQIAEHMKK